MPNFRSRIKEVSAGQSDAALLAALWNSAAGQLLTPIAELLPDDQIECLQLSETDDLRTIERVIVLLAALRTLKSDSRWIHYNLAKHLDVLLGDGVQAARLPCLLHCLLTRAQFADEPNGRDFAPAILARELLPLSPRDAAINAIEACAAGDGSAFAYAINAARSLGLSLDPGNPGGINDLRELAAHLGIQHGQDGRTSDARAACDRSTVVEAGYTIRLPEVRGDSAYYIFKQASEHRQVPPIEIFEFEGATVSIDISRQGLTMIYVFDREGRCVTDLSVGMEPFIADPVEDVAGSLAILDDEFSGPMNICHYLLDRLTRIAIYERGPKRPDRYLLADDFPYYAEGIARLGLTDRVITPAAKRYSIRADRLLVSSNTTLSFRHPAHYCAPWALGFLRTAFGEPDGVPSRKLYISRADAGGRREVNAAEVANFLTQRGYEIVTLAGMSMRQQVGLFAQASDVVGLHGAGLTNILFAQPRCRVTEIMPPLVATSAYWLLASALGHDYQAVVGTDPELPTPDYDGWRHDPRYNSRDVIVPVERLREML